MAGLYEGHTENARLAAQKGREKARELKQKRVDEYNANPKKCKECNNPIPYEKKNSKSFCDNSCSAKYTNKRRYDNGWTLSDEQRNKISEKIKIVNNDPSVKERLRENAKNTNKKKYGTAHPAQDKYNANPNFCKICGTKIEFGRHYTGVTCGSRECKTKASVTIRPYPNGRRKIIWYFNKWTNERVMLESSWEEILATFLDEHNVEWNRPSPIQWVDENNKTRQYYPDFFIPAFNLYVDPKNPYGMKRDQEKMQKISSTVNVIYGDIDDMKKHISVLIK